MGDSWRIGVDSEETTQLVRVRVFGLVRNPIYCAMLIFEFGITLLATNLVTTAGFFLALVSLELQVRRVEEPHLLTKHGAPYRDYTSSVGRFIPGVGLIRCDNSPFRRPARCHRLADGHPICGGCLLRPLCLTGALPRLPTCGSATRCPLPYYSSLYSSLHSCWRSRQRSAPQKATKKRFPPISRALSTPVR
jgi:hypothetical protein